MLSENKDEILFSIEDDGMGFDINLHYDRTKPESLHFGLINMRERTEQLGGNFHIESSMGKGTCVEISIPIKKKT